MHLLVTNKWRWCWKGSGCDGGRSWLKIT